MSITRNLNGGITISDIVNGYLVQRTYYGYSVRECKKLFKSEVK